jgi:hypothetical protein
MKITDKAQMLALQQSGKLGNFLRTYSSIDELSDIPRSRPLDYFTIQNKQSDSPFFAPEVIGVDVPAEIERLLLQGAYPSTIYVRDIPPPGTRRIIQGEFSSIPGREWGGFELYFTTGGDKNLRHDLEERGRRLSGFAALTILRACMEDSAQEDLLALLDQYPEHVIEFTYFDRPCGVFNRNLVVWEVRHY